MSELTILYGTQRLIADVRRTARTTIEIVVTPESAIRVTAPFATADTVIAERLRARAAWVLRQQRYFAQFRPRTLPRQWVSGETHRHLGRQVRIRLGQRDAPTTRVHLTRGHIVIDGVAFDDSTSIERAVRRWQRQRANALVSRRLPVCTERFDEPVAPTSVRLRTMAGRWASMSAQGELTVHPGLVQAPTDAVDYVLTHELAHRLVPDHSAAFWRLLDRVMPDHRRRKALLERSTA